MQLPFQVRTHSERMMTNIIALPITRDLAYCILYRFTETKENSIHKHWLEQCFIHKKEKRHSKISVCSVSRSPRATGSSPQPTRVVGLHTGLSSANEDQGQMYWLMGWPDAVRAHTYTTQGTSLWPQNGSQVSPNKEENFRTTLQLSNQLPHR